MTTIHTETPSSLLKPAIKTSSLHSSQHVLASVARFNKTAGSATEIARVDLTYFAAANCLENKYQSIFSTALGGTFFPLDMHNDKASLNSSSAYKVATNQLGEAQIPNIKSVLVRLSSPDGSKASFVGSACDTNGDCCVPITCDTGSENCTSSMIGEQDFTLEDNSPTMVIETSDPLLLEPGTSGSIEVTNLGTQNATDVSATLPNTMTDILQDASACTSLAPRQTCRLIFTAPTYPYSVSPAQITVFGSNNTSTITSPYLSVGMAWGANNTVNTMVEDKTNHRLYIGGSFTQVGVNTSGAPINTGTVALLPSFPRVNLTVRSVIADGNGGWYIGGLFTNVGGVVRNRIAHINSDYSVDLNFNPDANDAVFTLLLNGNTLYVGGAFSNIGGVARNNIAALDTATGTATSFNPNANDTVFSLALNGTTLYVGGLFTTIGTNNQNRNVIAALTTAGAATGFNPNATHPTSNAQIYTMVFNSATSTLYVGGIFANIGGQSRNNIAALDTTTTTGTARNFNPNTTSIVRALLLNNNTLYVGGDFTSVSGGTTTRNRIAAYNVTLASGTTITNFNPNANGTVNSLAFTGSTLYVGGAFTTIGTNSQNRNRIAALDTSTTGTATGFNPIIAGSTVNTLALNGNTLYAGGNFNIIGGELRNRIAALDTRTGNLTSFNPNATTGIVNTLLLNGTTLYVGGTFASPGTIGGQVRNRIAALDTTTTGTATPFDPNATTGAVNALLLKGTTLYVGGTFASPGTIGGQLVTALLLWIQRLLGLQPPLIPMQPPVL